MLVTIPPFAEFSPVRDPLVCQAPTTYNLQTNHARKYYKIKVAVIGTLGPLIGGKLLLTNTVDFSLKSSNYGKNFFFSHKQL